MSVVMVTTNKSSETSSSNSSGVAAASTTATSATTTNSAAVNSSSSNSSSTSLPLTQHNSSIGSSATSTIPTTTTTITTTTTLSSASSSGNPTASHATTSINVAPSFVFEYDPSGSESGGPSGNSSAASSSVSVSVGGTSGSGHHNYHHSHHHHHPHHHPHKTGVDHAIAVEAIGGHDLATPIAGGAAGSEEDGVVVASAAAVAAGHHDNNLSILLYGQSKNGSDGGGGGGLCTVSPHVIFGRMHSEPERPLPLIEFASLQPPVELQTLANPNHRSCPEISPSEHQLYQQQQQAQYQQYLLQQAHNQHSSFASSGGRSSVAGPADAQHSMSIESTGSSYRGGGGGYGSYSNAAAASFHRCSISTTGSASTVGRQLCSPRVKRHLWPSHARSVLSSRLEHSFLTRTVSRESMRLSTHALNSGGPPGAAYVCAAAAGSHAASGSAGGSASAAAANSSSGSCTELQPLMAGAGAFCTSHSSSAAGGPASTAAAGAGAAGGPSSASNYLSSCAHQAHSNQPSPQHGPSSTCYSGSSTGHHLVGSSPLRSAASRPDACCSAAGCLYHLGSSTGQLPGQLQQHLPHHRPSLLDNEIAEIAADSMRINGALRQFRQLRKATNASTLSMPAAEKGSFTAANSLEVTADASTPLMNATSDHRTPQQFLSQRSFASNSLDSEKKKSTTIKSGFHKPNVGYRLGRRKGTYYFHSCFLALFTS